MQNIPTLRSKSLRALSRLLLLLCAYLPLATSHADTTKTFYDVHYSITLQPPKRAKISLTVGQSNGELKRLRFVLRDNLWREFKADGKLEHHEGEVIWSVPRSGGTISWRTNIEGVKSDAFDAMLTSDWGVFRAGDVIPPIASTTRRGAFSKTSFSLELPKKWTAKTPYRETDGVYYVDNPERRFDKPTGWIVAGDIGVRDDTIDGVYVAVAAPQTQGARRLDVLAFLNWHMPHINALFPEFPKRILIAMAADPFFRGGLSAPNSIFIHAQRPLISENATSTLLHELVHVGISRAASRDNDWIVEGLAEFYSQELLLRSGTITAARHQQSVESLASWGKQSATLRTDNADGATRALATGIFRALDQEIKANTNKAHSLDTIVAKIAARRSPISLDELRKVCEQVNQSVCRTLSAKRLPGYASDAR